MNVHVDQSLNARPSIKWRVIDQIYATGSQPGRWPELLDALVRMSALESARLEQELTPHIRQALRVHEALLQSQGLEEVEPLLEALNFPFLVVTAELRVLYRSGRFSCERYAGSCFRVRQDRLDLALPAHRKQMRGLFAGERDLAALGSFDDWKVDESLEVIALRLHDDLAAICLVDVQANRIANVRGLQARFGLTGSEASLLADLVEDIGYGEMAQRRGVSENTVRSQVKQIFAKTGTRRRADLVLLVCCGPQLLQSVLGSLPPAFIASDTEQPRHHQQVQLPDGGKLGFAEFGPEDGRPVVFLHNVSGSRLQLPVPEADLAAQNVRLIVPDRPGVGLSVWRRRCTMRGWSEAFAALLDHLGLDAVPLLGNSVGGIYAMACAAFVPERIGPLALVSTMAEMDPATDLERLENDMQRVVSLGSRHPRLAAVALRLLIRDHPNRYVDRRIRNLPEVDQALYRIEGFYQMAVTAITENMRQGVAPMARDFVLLSRPWEFDVSAIEVPVQLWHGTCDITSPLPAVRRLAARLEHCESTIIEGETHMLLHRHWHTIVQRLLAAEDRGAA